MYKYMIMFVLLLHNNICQYNRLEIVNIIVTY